jgi:hypothetical protein
VRAEYAPNVGFEVKSPFWVQQTTNSESKQFHSERKATWRAWRYRRLDQKPLHRLHVLLFTNCSVANFCEDLREGDAVLPSRIPQIFFVL